MILGECGVFIKMLTAGLAAGLLARSLHILGSASRSARFVCDALIAVETGAAYFLSLYLSAGGVFRLYSLAAFLLGVFLSLSLLLRFSPFLRRFAAKALSPLLKGYRKVEKSLEKRLRPFFEKREAKRRKRHEMREAARLARQKEREDFRAKNEARKEENSRRKHPAKNGLRRVEIEH